MNRTESKVVSYKKIQVVNIQGFDNLKWWLDATCSISKTTSFYSLNVAINLHFYKFLWKSANEIASPDAAQISQNLPSGKTYQQSG